MTDEHSIQDAALTIRQSISNLARRLRQTRGAAGLSWGESLALAQLVRGGPATSAELARSEGISPQSMGATLKGLERIGLIARGADPEDGRRVVLSATDAGRRFYGERLDARAHQMGQSLSEEFTAEEIEQLLAVTPLLDRLAARIHVDASRLSSASPQHGRDADLSMRETR